MLDRPFDFFADRSAIETLWLAHRLDRGLTQYPTLWRLRLLASSRLGDPEQDGRLWFDKDGTLLGCALLWRRNSSSPYRVLERQMLPGSGTAELDHAMLTWALNRTRLCASELHAPFDLYATPQNADPGAIHRLVENGFSPVNPDPLAREVYFWRSLEVINASPDPPNGYTFHRLRNIARLDALETVVSFAPVSPDHRLEQLASNEYCLLLAEDLEGAIAGYCEVSFCRDEWTASGERIGWIDYIEIIPARQRLGLGAALLTVGQHWLAEAGAASARLVTGSFNQAAIQLYQKSAFIEDQTPQVPAYQYHFPLA